jgi:single-stranded-DNA-specific exonuclease
LDGISASAVLGVERSLSGLRWRARAGDDRVGLALAQRLGVPEIVGRILAARGIGIDEAENFLNPTLRASLPDPLRFKDMAQAVARLVAAVRGGETIAIFGDYDVDGATASSLLHSFLTQIGARTIVYIPDRQREGYGPNAAALLKLKAQGAGVVVTVDCGVTAHAPLEAAARAGLDVIVIDHHVAEPALPMALAVVNPNRLDESGEHGTLAAVGLAFLLAVGLNRALRQAGWYQTRAEPDLMSCLDLVALGTICDVVPLVGLNRALVAQGLKVMRKRGNIGIAALADVGGVRETLDAYHAGFILGPRVNAGGRIGEAGLGAMLLSCADPAEAKHLAERLDALNRERREIEARVLAEAIAKVEAMNARGAMVFVAAENWHAGVIGIVASRLRERYRRPACVIAIENGVAKGSGRSVPGVALGPAIIAARQEGLLMSGGGHAMAAGFVAEAGKLEALAEFLEARIGAAMAAREFAPELGIDGVLALGAANAALVEATERLAPFGTGNAEPRFAIADARLVHAEVVGGQHLRCIFGDASGATRLKSIRFRAFESALGDALVKARGTSLHVAGHLRPDRWQDRDELQLMIDDAATTSPR